MMPRTRLLTTLFCLLAAAVVVSGCGDDDSGSASEATNLTQTQTQAQTETTPTQTTPQETAAPKARKVRPTAGEADIDRKPKVPQGKGGPPRELVVQDLIVGKGKRAKAGDTVSVQTPGGERSYKVQRVG